MIGEQKFGVECDSPESERICALEERYGVPVLLHSEHGTNNLGIGRFHKVLEKFPRVNFIGHLQIFWAHIDGAHKDQKILYPKGPVTPGGITDRRLTDHPNRYGDLSAGSGPGSLTRPSRPCAGCPDRSRSSGRFGSRMRSASSGCECRMHPVIWSHRIYPAR